ncbi:MAG: sugar ABC transporter substrate-binding protein [Thermoanaerobaculia bacterium]
MARHARALIAFPALLLAAAACAPGSAGETERVIRFWGLGREGEVVKELMPEFERENPGIRVVVQQVPWTAAHEKLLTGFVGGSPPDLAQLGNTWIPEFAAIGALEPLEPRVAASTVLAPGRYFEGIWKTNLFDGKTYGIPWYVDTRVLFYRRDLLEKAGYTEVPRTWSQWREAMEKIRGPQGSGRFAILLPTNEWEQLTILGLQMRSPLLADNGTRGAFSQPPFQTAAEWYVGLFHDGLAPVVSYTQLGNPYQEFSRGYVGMWITGPWNLGEFRRRLPPELQDIWMTAPVPAPDGAEWPGYSLAGGSSLSIFRASKDKEAAWRLIEYLSRPEIQSRFYGLVGDLPARTESWNDPVLAGDGKARAFREQLDRVTPLPRVPEWEQIAQKIQEDMEAAIRGKETVAASLSKLDADVDRILEKRRWILSRQRERRGR